MLSKSSVLNSENDQQKQHVADIWVIEGEKLDIDENIPSIKSKFFKNEKYTSTELQDYAQDQIYKSQVINI